MIFSFPTHDPCRYTSVQHMMVMHGAHNEGKQETIVKILLEHWGTSKKITLSLHSLHGLHSLQSAWPAFQHDRTSVNLYIEKKPFTWKPIKGHKSTHGPHRRDVTHILSKVSCFLLKSFHFRRLQKRFFFSHKNPYILNVTQQCRCSPMIIFPAWATCGRH